MVREMRIFIFHTDKNGISVSDDPISFNSYVLTSLHRNHKVVQFNFSCLAEVKILKKWKIWILPFVLTLRRRLKIFGPEIFGEKGVLHARKNWSNLSGRPKI